MSLGTSNRDGGKTSESGHLRALAKMVTGDVITGLNVSQRSAGANMSVDIAIGDAFVRRSDGSYAHPVFNDAVYNQAIAAADGSNPRRDLIVLYVDYSQAPSTAVSNNTNGVVKIKVVTGTPAGSPVDPNSTAIQSSVGAGNPYTVLARVRVPAGQTSITNTLIDDLRSIIKTKDVGDLMVGTSAIQLLAITKALLAAASLGAGKIDYADWLNVSRMYQFRTSGNQSTTSSSYVTIAGNSGNFTIAHTTRTGRVKVRIQAPIGNSANNAQIGVTADGGATWQEIANFSKNDATYVGCEGVLTGLTPNTAYNFTIGMKVDGGATVSFYAFRMLTMIVEDF